MAEALRSEQEIGMRYWILDDAGEPKQVQSIEEWAHWANKDLGGANVVVEDAVEDMRISTIFLAIDHGWGKKPALWETMVFGGALAGEARRYTSKKDAIAGHVAMVATAIATAEALRRDKS